MRRRPARLICLLSAATAALVVVTGAAAQTTLWPTYHFDAGRSGNDTGEPAFSGLSSSWTTGSLDGAIYAEPLVAGSDVIVATENNTVYAFNAGTGGVHWSVHLGTPRTSNFPCGDIMPLGITGTPLIDAGWLYAVTEIQTSSTTFEFHLNKVSLSNGAIAYITNITPAGMDTNVHQERSALALSNGNIVVTWGGLDGDCGTYHGYVETVAESNGAPQHQWNDTVGGREGGIWATSGAAVDGAGNIYVATGNGSSTNISNYDYGDSVLKFSPSLALQSFFAPGAPQPWTQLNASDTDLGSLGPSTLPNGLLFSIGKGGRGYLLNQASLPSNSNPGGGENFSAQVCNATSDAAFGGLAVIGSTVFVPCADGIAAVSIDSASAFHRVWYQTGGGGAPPIQAGGLLWSGRMFGGTTLYGMIPATGQIVTRLALPATTQHFATPAAGDGHLFVGAGDHLAAFTPPQQFGSGDPPAAAGDQSGHEYAVWKGTDNNLWEASWTGSAWAGPTSLGMGPLGSPPSIAIQGGGEVDVFWKGTDANLWEATRDPIRSLWAGPFPRGMGPLGSAPTVAGWGSELDVFWEGTDRNLWEGFSPFGPSSWQGPQKLGMGPLGSKPTAAAHSNGEQDVFWQGTDRNLWEGFFNGTRWIGPLGLGMGPLGSQPSAAVLPNDEEDVVWRGTNLALWTATYNGTGWLGPESPGMGPLGSPPAAAAFGTELDAFWQGTDRNLWEGSRPSGSWTGPQNWGMGPLG